LCFDHADEVPVEQRKRRYHQINAMIDDDGDDDDDMEAQEAELLQLMAQAILATDDDEENEVPSSSDEEETQPLGGSAKGKDQRKPHWHAKQIQRNSNL
jgi:hypothetical protein